MISINKPHNNNGLLIKIFLFFFFITSWLSIGTSYFNLIDFFYQSEITTLKIINLLRVLINLLGFPILCYLFIKKIFEKKNNFFKSNLLFYAPLCYFLAQIPGLLYTTNSLGNIIYIISAINILIIVNLSVRIFKPNEIIWLIYISFILLLGVLLQSFIKDLYTYMFDPVARFYGQINTILNDSYIRSSGVSRIALILLIIYSFFFKKFIKSKFFKIIPFFVFSFMIFLYQSRAVIILLVLFILFITFFVGKFSLSKFFKYFCICIIIPFIASNNITALKLNNGENIRQLYNSAIENGYTGSQNDFQKKFITIEKTLFCEIINCSNKSVRLNNADDVFTTSGRVDDWTKIIDNFDFKNNLFFGYGSQGDRFLINQTASNGILYALSSSGIIGLLFFIIFSAIAGIKIVKYLLIKTEKNSIYIFSILIMIIFGVRSLVESSYAFFGIDFILFYTAFVLSEKYNIIKK
tara:strand:+ start:688 stop:2085 length:1398 start_codon:yes stop_codon:yes gene_type:complete